MDSSTELLDCQKNVSNAFADRENFENGAAENVDNINNRVSGSAPINTAEGTVSEYSEKETSEVDSTSGIKNLGETLSEYNGSKSRKVENLKVPGKLNDDKKEFTNAEGNPNPARQENYNGHEFGSKIETNNKLGAENVETDNEIVVKDDVNREKIKENVGGNNCPEQSNKMNARAVCKLQNKINSSESFADDDKSEELYKNQENFDIQTEDIDQDTVCGLWKFKPPWLQKYATARTYLIVYSIAGVLHGSYFTYTIGSLTTMEKRYAFESKVSGAIIMLQETTPMLGILMGYFGTKAKAHKPRIVALGIFLASVCCFISALPYLMYGTSQHLVASHAKNSTSREYCDREFQHESCDLNDRPPTLSAVACFLLGSFCKGFINLVYFTIGMSYMDDNSKKKNTPLYIGIASALRMVGPIVGFLLSSAFLKYYENPFGDPGYGPEDPRWIGAWWIGYLLIGILLLICTFPLLLFPRRLPRQRQQALPIKKYSSDAQNKEKRKGLITTIIRVLKNPVLVFFTFGTIFSIISNYGYGMLLPKYLEVQFRLSASDANLLSGPPCIATGIIMTVIGSAIIYALRPSAKIMIGCQAATEVVWIIGCFILMTPKCRDILMAGTTSTPEGLQLTNECNSDCMCSTNVFSPVCDPQSLSDYFSPCHAGCTNGQTESIEVLSNCSCVLNNGSFLVSDNIIKGYCPIEGCWTQAVIYVSVLTVLSAVANTFRVCHTIILLRCVDPKDKTIALGFFETSACAFAFIPLPLIFGALADAACLVWEKSCGETGNCWLYDVDMFNYLLHGTSAFFTALAVICYIVVIFKSHYVRDLYEEEDEFEFIASKKNKKISSSQSDYETLSST